MKTNSSRRNFLAAGLALPVAGLGSTTGMPSSAQDTAKLQPSTGGGVRYRTLGRTGLKVTAVGFGCMITSDASVIERAADIGISYFDTARGYQGGNNERMVGAALKGRRKNIVLSSKTHASSKQEALRDLDTSLKELGTEHLDIWYLHAKTSAGQITDDLLEAQQVARKQGKIRFAGVSTHGGQSEVIPAAIRAGTLDVVLTSYNFTMDKSIEEAIDLAHKAGVGIVAMKVMAGGFRRVRPGTSLYSTLKKDGAMVAALKWALRNPKVATTIPSMTDMDQLEDNLKAMAEPFTQSDEQLLAEQLQYIAPLYCRMCGKCEGTCPQGLPVADILRHLAYAEGYGQFSLGRERFSELPAEVKSVRCNLCPSCSVNCPYGVKIAERLTRAQELFA